MRLMSIALACNLDRDVLLHGPEPGTLHSLEQGASRRAESTLDQIEQVEAGSARLRVQILPVWPEKLST